jgi:hypothetical protein
MRRQNMKLCLALCSTVFLIGSVLFAQAPTETDQATKKTTNTATTKTKIHSATGRVKEFTQGKSIVVTTAKGKDVTFDLSGNKLTAHVAPDIAVGNNVRVVEKTDNNGNKTVTVSPSSGSHHAEKKTGASQ